MRVIVVAKSKKYFKYFEFETLEEFASWLSNSVVAFGKVVIDVFEVDD